MTPASSWPSVIGQGSGLGQWPFRMCRSVPHTPHESMRIKAAFAGTEGRGTEFITGGRPGPSKLTTDMLSADSVTHTFPSSRVSDCVACRRHASVRI